MQQHAQRTDAVMFEMTHAEVLIVQALSGMSTAADVGMAPV